MQRKVAVLLLIALIAVALFGASNLMGLHIGYISGSQGLSAEFNSVFYKNYWYDQSHAGPNPNYNGYTASAHDFFDRVNFDPDGADDLLPNIKASQDAIVVDQEVEPRTYGPWRVKVGEYPEQNSTHSWTVEDYKEFEIKRYKCYWSVDVWLDGTYSEAWPDQNRHYLDAQLWIKIVPQTFAYFMDNPDQVFFAPAFIQLDRITWGALDMSGNPVSDPAMGSYQDIFPEAVGESLGIYYARGGQAVNLNDTTLAYQGLILDSSIFRNEYWVRLGLDNFYPVSWFAEPGHSLTWHMPSVNLRFATYVFMVGKWTVQLQKGDIKPLEPHPSTYFYDILQWLGYSVSQLLSNPYAQLWIFFIIIAVVVIVVSVASPGVWTALAHSRKKS